LQFPTGSAAAQERDAHPRRPNPSISFWILCKTLDEAAREVNDSSPEGVPYKPNFFCGSVLVVCLIDTIGHIFICVTSHKVTLNSFFVVTSHKLTQSKSAKAHNAFWRWPLPAQRGICRRPMSAPHGRSAESSVGIFQMYFRTKAVVSVKASESAICNAK
jgi:hypothetical protein